VPRKPQPKPEEWLWGWDPTPGIVSVFAEPDGRAWVWRRVGRTLHLDEVRFRPWVVLASLDDLTPGAPVTFTELEGPGALRFLVRADDGNALTAAVLGAASRRLGRSVDRLRDLEKERVLALAPEEQYLVATGRNYFRDLGFDELRRMQFDLETTGLDPETDRIFLIAVRDPDGRTDTLEHPDEAELLRALVARVQAADPDVIENHNLHGFDLPFLARRAEHLGVPLHLGRLGSAGFRFRSSARGRGPKNGRHSVPGRELIDTMDAVLRHDFSARDLPGHGLKAVARHFGLAGDSRELIPGAEVASTYETDPERVRRYARADVEEAAGLARTLGGSAFALARMAPRRYERLADAGPATGILDPLLVRAYLRSGAALPAHEPSDGTEHTGASLHLFAAGVARRIVKADVASLYPSLMREHRIGPRRDRLGVLVTLVDRLVELRLAAKDRARAAPAGSAERFTDEALAAAMKIVVNSAYGYLGASGLTRFSDVHAANQVTHRGRELLAFLCRELAARGVTLLEADTDGVYFSVPEGWQEADERRVVAEIGALLPARVRLEFDGRYAAMLSHEPKNYALLPYGDKPLLLRGVAFRSSRAEPFGEEFIRRAVDRLLHGDVPGVRAAFVETIGALRQRTLPTADVLTRARLTKSPVEYMDVRAERRDPAYEAVLLAGRTEWDQGERIRFYRAIGNRPTLVSETDDDDGDAPALSSDPRDYDVEHYVRQLTETYATRLVRAFRPEDYAAVFAPPEQLLLFPVALADVKPILTVV
jgi:DNA polymerase elongation subunit (family B)